METKMVDTPVCAIIGAGAGMGRAIARRFAREGYRLALFARSGAAAEAEAMRAEGFTADAAALDAGDANAVTLALAAAGPVRVLIYNAAAVTQARPLALSPTRLQADFAVSVVGALAAAQVVAPGMAEAGGGSILLTGGGFALRPMAALASLGVGKAALRNLAFSLAEELGPMGIRVGTVTILGMVAPGGPFDPDAIAEAYWALHADRQGALGVETSFAGRPA
jgi:short-subunit dehydrogenase